MALSATEKKMESTPSAHGHAQAQPSAQNIFRFDRDRDRERERSTCPDSVDALVEMH